MYSPVFNTDHTLEHAAFMRNHAGVVSKTTKINADTTCPDIGQMTASDLAENQRVFKLNYTLEVRAKWCLRLLDVFIWLSRNPGGAAEIVKLWKTDDFLIFGNDKEILLQTLEVFMETITDDPVEWLRENIEKYYPLQCAYYDLIKAGLYTPAQVWKLLSANNYAAFNACGIRRV